MREGDFEAKLFDEMTDTRDSDAAHTLVLMANSLLSLPKNQLPSVKRNHGLVRTAAGKLSKTVFVDGKKQHTKRILGDGKMKTSCEKFSFRLNKTVNEERKQRKRKLAGNFSKTQIKKLKTSCIRDKEQEEKPDSKGNSGLSYGHERFGVEYLEQERATKSRKANSGSKGSIIRSLKLIDDPNFFEQKSCLKKLKMKHCYLGCEKINDLLVSEKEDTDYLAPKTRSSKKELIVRTEFSFSIIHLLASVRDALVTPQMEQTKLPSLTFDEIVERVRSKNGDPSILETKDPIRDLVRGVLYIFSYKTASLGASGCNSLIVYEKTSKRWSWVGPISYDSTHKIHIEEEIDFQAWGISPKTLMKLVDIFAGWLKQGQEMLQQIGNLPSPPLMLMQPADMNERFKDTKVLRSLSTINPSCDEIRAYFRKEEALRYVIPERTFSYTALDGKKTAVAPLRRCGDKQSVKVRYHFMLKENRPPHFTVLCLVRDAAARLPGRIGTRADVCTLLRDSQFVVEDITDLQVNQVVSGALDRLHSEFDPCVQFDRDRHMWVYLHGEREEEDFLFDCTSSRKKGNQLREL